MDSWENAPFPTPTEWAEFHAEALRWPGRSSQDWALKKPGLNPFLLHKWDALQRQSKKWPTWHANPNLWFAPRTFAEQASSEATARAKVQWLLHNGTVETAADLTLGSGADSWALADAGIRTVGTEPNPALVRVLQQHEQVLNLPRRTVLGSADDFPWDCVPRWDAVVVDPSRREIGGKRWDWDHSQPNPLECWDLWAQKAPQVLIKTSPRADADALERSFPNATDLVFVAVDGEMKEIWVVKRPVEANQGMVRWTLHTTWNARRFSFRCWDRTATPPLASSPATYLYLPDAALKASRCHAGAAAELGLEEWSPGLYTANHRQELWPGRRLRFQEQFAPYKGSTEGGWSIASINYPEKPDQIRKKLRCQEDSERFLLATVDRAGQRWFVTALVDNS